MLKPEGKRRPLKPSFKYPEIFKTPQQLLTSGSGLSEARTPVLMIEKIKKPAPNKDRFYLLCHLDPLLVNFSLLCEMIHSKNANTFSVVNANLRLSY
jgi:hypothetical protein